MEQQVPSSLVTIERGTCYVLFAYDVALAINLDEVEQQISALRQRGTSKHKHPAPASFEYRPAPIRVTQSAEPLAFGDYRSNPSVDLVLYDFGAVSVLYSIPLHGPFSGLVTLSEELYDNAVLLADSRQRVEQLMAVIQHAVVNVDISALVEDYVIFQLVSWQPSCSPLDRRLDCAAVRLRDARTLALDQKESIVSDDCLSEASRYYKGHNLPEALAIQECLPDMF